VFEPNSNKPLTLISGGQLYFYQLDQLGTPLSLTDSDNNIVWQAHYTVFGKATVTINDIHNPIRFQGQYYDNESGLHYNHFRYYDPTTGRFISQDPIGLLGGINHYQYAPNHINWVDPLGLSCKEGEATIFKIGHGSEMHFAVQVKSKNGVVKTHQLGGIGTKTLIDEFDESAFSCDVQKIVVKLPDAISAQEYQKSLLIQADNDWFDSGEVIPPFLMEVSCRTSAS